MIIEKIYPLTHKIEPDFAWKGLRRFHNVNFVRDTIIETHNVQRKHQNLARKQAEQIRLCLIQAHEYHHSFNHATLLTKPTLLYYSIMYLAIAEFLFKGTGDVSLDKARAKHRHHGLIFSCDERLKSERRLDVSASLLSAKPMLSGGKRIGTFHLWHSFAREHPYIGPHRRVTSNSSTTSHSIILNANSKKLSVIPETGVNFMKCLKNFPGSKSYIELNSIHSELARASIRVDVDLVRDKFSITLILHPDTKEKLDKIYSKIEFHPNYFERLVIDEFESGLQLRFDSSSLGGANFPIGFNSSGSEVLLCSDNDFINEFGLAYLGMFICGNFSRYYPDIWVKHLDEATPLALAIEDFTNSASRRAPLLTLSELSRGLFVDCSV